MLKTRFLKISLRPVLYPDFDMHAVWILSKFGPKSYLNFSPELPLFYNI